MIGMFNRAVLPTLQPGRRVPKLLAPPKLTRVYMHSALLQQLGMTTCLPSRVLLLAQLLTGNDATADH